MKNSYSPVLAPSICSKGRYEDDQEFHGRFMPAHRTLVYVVYLTVNEAKTSEAEVMARGFGSMLRYFYKTIGYKTIGATADCARSICGCLVKGGSISIPSNFLVS